MFEQDPDRWVNPQAPGAHEWWYFDAISHDGRDALVLVWYSALPFDPAYGLASLRHLSNPQKHPKPHPLDHCAIGFSWYRDGKTLAYALNVFNRDQFSHTLDSKGLELHVGGNGLRRLPDNTYSLQINTPILGIGPKRAHVELTFRPSSGLTGWEKDLGTADHPHLWMLAAADCAVEGEITAGKQRLSFKGRGYHDHNAGDDELSRSFHRWHWGRFHHAETTEIYYVCEPAPGQSEGLWIECSEGRVKHVEPIERLTGQTPKKTVFGIRYHEEMARTNQGMNWKLGKPVDHGPFYLRWVSQSDQTANGHGQGICELLQADFLHQKWFNWMIPYRLKRPGM
jgi:carotenoid 1,2-hydratase